MGAVRCTKRVLVAPLPSMCNNSPRCHLRWDSLGEYLALNVAFQDLAVSNPKAKVLSHALEKAVGRFLSANKNPSRKVNEIDNRGSHYWVARYWAEELAQQSQDKGLKQVFTPIAKELA